MADKRVAINELPENVLPTSKDVIDFVNFINANSLEKFGNRVIAKVVGEEVIMIWKKASIPTIKLHSIVNRIVRLIDEWNKLEKYVGKTRETEYFKHKMSLFSNLFDVAACRCDLQEKCFCVKENCVPSEEIPFLTDQRSSHKMFLGGLDRATTKILQTRRPRSHQTSQSQLNVSVAHSNVFNDSSEKTVVGMEDETDEDSTFCPPPRLSRNLLRFNNSVPLKRLGTEVDRFGLSNRAVAAVFNAALIDLNILTPRNRMLVIDHKKLERSRKAVRKSSIENHEFGLEKISAIYADGKIDRTIALQKQTLKTGSCDQIESVLKTTIEEEHYTVVYMPGDFYLIQFTPASSKAIDMMNGLWASVEEHTSYLKSLRCRRY